MANENQNVNPSLAAASLAEVLGLGAALSQPKILPPGQHGTGAPFAIVPKDYGILDLSKLLPAPARASGNVVLADMQSFIRYVNKHKDAPGAASRAAQGPVASATDAPAQPVSKDDVQTVIMVDPIKSKFRAAFNHHASDAPGWGDHTATYDCPASPEWVEWNAKDGHRFKQEDFAFFVEQNMLDIVTPSGSDLLQIVTTLKTKKDVQFDSAIRLDNGQTQLKYHEQVQGSAGEAGQLTIPEEIKLGIPVYVGGAAYSVPAKFRYRIEGGRLQMWYDLIRPHKILEDALGKLVTQVSAGTEIEPYSVSL